MEELDSIVKTNGKKISKEELLKIIKEFNSSAYLMPFEEIDIQPLFEKEIQELIKDSIPGDCLVLEQKKYFVACLVEAPEEYLTIDQVKKIVTYVPGEVIFWGAKSSDKIKIRYFFN